MDINESERGNSAFSNEEGHAVIFIELDEPVHQPDPNSTKFKFLQSAYSPMNYPVWDVSTIEITKEKLRDHIAYNLGGWHVDKNNLNVNATDDSYVLDATDIIEDVVDHAINQAHAGDYDPTATQGMVSSGIWDSAVALSYTLSDKLHAEAVEVFEDEFDNSTIGK